ncbi:MAG: DUF1127 domain-containing protein [Pseudomonadota bacterium]
MASFDMSAVAHGAAAPRTGVLRMLAARFRAWQTARRTAAALRALSPALLDDIGIEPGDIDGFADRMAGRGR